MALRRLTECYEAFRTAIGITAGGCNHLALHEVGDDEIGPAERLSYEYRGRGFDDDEWPLRVAMIILSGEPAPDQAAVLAPAVATDWELGEVPELTGLFR
ncbi:hypothetical protein [Sphaerisporangium fuscum]|uniref:hypothetical protein n=1 Tax=Sphaerisporangium fuscum TaxID=2835868 RepID=UPI001BDC9B68|nr:hypothetical protein [Sphaerisporangium fuscum]